MSETKTMTVQEASERMGVSAQFIRNAIRQGSMPGLWIHNSRRDTFRIPREQFENFILGKKWSKEKTAVGSDCQGE